MKRSGQTAWACAFGILFAGTAWAYEVSSPNEIAGGQFGRRPAGVPDLDSDGYGDIVVGAPFDNGVGIVMAGRAYVFSGRTGKLLYKLNSPNEQNDGRFGFFTDGIADLDGDGDGDVIVGAPNESGQGGTATAGRAYIFSGRTGTLLWSLSSPNEEILGRFGQAVAGSTDLTGDGRGDVIVSAQFENVAPFNNCGRAYVFSGATGALRATLVSPNRELDGEFSQSVASVPDANGDTFADIVIGAPNEDPGALPSNCGMAYVFSGATTGTLLLMLASPNAEVDGAFGFRVGAVDDVNADTAGDIIVGAYKENVAALTDAGRAYVFSGAAAGPPLWTLISPNAQTTGSFGWFVSGIPDVNGDLAGDLLVGAVDENLGVGRAYNFSGATGLQFLTFNTPHPEYGGNFGWTVSGITDITGDGLGDVVIGAPNENPNGSPLDAGRAYTFNGFNGLSIPPPQFDFGDAPDVPYPTLAASNGAEHVITPGFCLGATVDGEADGLPNITATGDDANNTNDDDGVTFFSAISSGANVNVQVIASMAGVLDAWIDFDRDGSWSQPQDRIFSSQGLIPGSNALAFIAPGTVSAGTTMARFRFSLAGVAAPTGLAPEGEVEDYAVTIYPCSATMVILDSVAAHDGWIRAAVANSSIETTGSALRIGDATTNQRYTSIVSFNTAVIPAGSVFLSADLTLTRGARVGFPDTSSFVPAYVEIRSGAFSGNLALQNVDSAAAAHGGSGVLSPLTIPSPPGVDGAKHVCDLVNIMNLINTAGGPNAGFTQFRIRFTGTTDTDATDDQYQYFSGEHATSTNRPKLRVVYCPAPTPTPSPTASSSPTSSATPSPTESPSPSPTATESPSPSPTESASPTESPSPTATESPSPTETETASPTATESPSPTESETPTASPTESETPTPSPSPTPNAALDWSAYE